MVSINVTVPCRGGYVVIGNVNGDITVFNTDLKVCQLPLLLSSLLINALFIKGIEDC